MTSTNTDLDWKTMYVEQQCRIAESLGCLAHPNNIHEAIRDLQRRAAGGDRKRARRRDRIKTAVIKALKAEGITDGELKGIDDNIDRVTQDLVRPR